MAPYKGIRTYANSRKKPLSESGRALNTLLAVNLKKRLETSNNTSGPSKEQSLETTFDRLLKGEFYNNVQFKNFPKNDPASFEQSTSSIFSVSTNTAHEDQRKDIVDHSIQSSNSKCSPQLVQKSSLHIHKNGENQTNGHEVTDEESVMEGVTNRDSRRNEMTHDSSSKDNKNINPVSDGDTRRQRYNRFRSKLLLMNSLELKGNEDSSFYNNFEHSVKGISTPQKYYLRKRRRPVLLNQTKNNMEFQDTRHLNLSAMERINSSVLSNEQVSLSITHSYSEINNESINKRRKSSPKDELCTADSSNINNIRDQDEIIDIEDSIEPTSSTPLHLNISISEDLSTSLLTKSYGIINDWSNRYPSPNIFSTSHRSKIIHKKQSIVNKYEFKRRKDSKLFQKTRVILKHMPHLDNILKNACKNSTPLEVDFLNVKNVSKYITRRKVIPKRKKSQPAENCSVGLDQLELSKLRTSFVRLESMGDLTKRLTSNKNTSESSSIDEKAFAELKKSRKTKEDIPFIKMGKNSGRNSGNQASFIDEHFKNIPKVILERCVFPEKTCTRKSCNSDISSDLCNSSTPLNSPNKFRGFNASMSTCEDSQMKMRGNIIRRSQDHKFEAEKALPLTRNNFQIKDCFVILERMNFDSILDSRKIQSELEDNKSKKRSSDCWVVLNDSKNISRGSNTEDNEVLQEFNWIKPQMKEFVRLEAGKKFRRSMAILKRNMEEKLNVSGRIDPVRRTTVGRRNSVKLIPVSPTKNQLTELASFAFNNSGYASLRQSGRRSSLEEVENYLSCQNFNEQLTARDIVLKRCGQTQPINFETCYPTSALQHCQKIGEGVFGEVFMIRDKDGSTTVMKVIPIEGEQIVNLEKQKTFGEILSEIIISMELSNLRISKRNNTDAFVKVKKINCVEGCYPDRLLELWELYDENKQSENDSPDMFLSDQLYIVLELANAGQDLESFQFTNAQQALAVFEQITCALAVAESQLQFEHRDLHWGNVLITPTENKNTIFVLDGKEIIVNNRGVKATIIDFTLSRVEHEGVIIFNDLSMDEDLFTAKGDYQFDIYRKMQENNGNRWQTFKPYSNILWLHYILGKAISGFRYRNAKSKQHKSSMTILKAYEDQILDYHSTVDFIEKNFSSQILIH